MNTYFTGISEEEYELLKHAVVDVTVLIAGADGVIDQEEKDWAEKIANIRTFSGPEILRDFYKEVEDHFDDHLEQRIKSLSDEVDERNTTLAESLRDLNPILAKLPQIVGATYYESLTSLAEHVAKASGGFMRFWAISAEEADWAQLPMINPIDFPEIEE